RWHFTDRKPQQPHETLEMVVAVPQPKEPQLVYVRQQDGTQQLMAINPWLAPVQFEVRAGSESITNWLMEPRSEKAVLHDDQPLVWKPNYEYRYLIGKPINRGDMRPLQPPIPPQGRFLISQAFNGTFSHKEEPSLHAVDIVMRVGEGIHDAREGLVVTVKDDYHMGGTDK